jgi:hypothetical protein
MSTAEIKDIQTRFKVSFVEFVRPSHTWPYPYSVEQAFQTLRWMTATGADYRGDTRWGDQGVYEVLSMKPSCRGFTGVSPITSLADLRQRFHYALLSRSEIPVVDKWRRDYDILPDGKATIHLPVHRDLGVSGPFKNQSELQKAITEMLEPPAAQKIQMTVALNSVHGKETAIYHDVQIKVSRNGFGFILRYGDEQRHAFGSRWDEYLACTRGNETFIETAVRAYKNYRGLVFGEIPKSGLDLEDMWSGFDSAKRQYVSNQLEEMNNNPEATLECAAPGLR